jgi:N-acetyl-anhydromuramyl-L-alanine amidase AmpD
MTSKNTTEPNKATQPDINETSIGILLNSLASNGVIVDAERFTQLYLTEINIAYNDGQLAALSSLAK